MESQKKTGHKGTIRSPRKPKHETEPETGLTEMYLVRRKGVLDMAPSSGKEGGQ